MKSQQEILDAVRGGRESGCLDGRDYDRLTDFFPAEVWKDFGFEPKHGVEVPPPKAWTEQAVVEQLKADVAFGFEKALNKRGISASSMYTVVKMWLWVLGDPLETFADDLYPQYGLPFLKAVAAKYGFPNPIGDDAGDEDKYSMDG